MADNTNGGGSGTSGAVVAIVAILAILVVVWFVFLRSGGAATDGGTDVDVDINPGNAAEEVLPDADGDAP